jgi:hypothetical protein
VQILQLGRDLALTVLELGNPHVVLDDLGPLVREW